MKKQEPRYFVIQHLPSKGKVVIEFKYKSMMDNYCETRGYMFQLKLDEDGLNLIKQ